MAIGSGGGDHGEASPRGSTVEVPRHRHPRNWGRDVRDAEDEASGARRRVARVPRAIEPIRIPPTSPVVSCEKKDPKLRGRARKARRGERATFEPGPRATRNDRRWLSVEASAVRAGPVVRLASHRAVSGDRTA